ncbi:unnamed protein product [Brachionus calyciflorus]|uniref:Tartrate-resistant acid phosphatase type 5 n=1 Tax=Brachionus calyciflorus TaxID=104777 RepID=A0A813T714_9BILA|nr:unnamed protein product [Brachionus calyciflorus]
MKRFIKLILAQIFLLAVVNSKRNSRKFLNSNLLIDNDRVKLDLKDDNVNFLVIGDWGGLPVFPYRTIIETQVSKQMTKLGEMYNTQFQLALGDNFYFNGVIDENDKRFKETYEKVFNSKRLKETPWFVLMGNHDHYGNASAQIEYTKQSDNWILPSYNYTIDIKTKQGDNLISILMVDTVLLCGNSGYDWELDKQPKLKSMREKLVANSYLEAFEEELRRVSETDVSYILVAGHFPVWSIAEHGPTQCLQQRLKPLLHKYKVSAYFCGHDHNLQYLEDTYMDHPVQYIVSGAANFVDNSTKHIDDVPENSLKFHWAEGLGIVSGGFMITQANAQNMTFSFYESNGKALYQNIIYPRKL